MDDADLASENMEAFKNAAIEALKAEKSQTVSNGVCRSCGENIEDARLQANPYAAFCCDCAEEEEIKRRKARRCGPV